MGDKIMTGRVSNEAQPLAEALGQMFVLGFRGLEVAEGHWIARAIAEENLGGVLLFDRNVEGLRQNIVSPDQVATLNATLQGLAASPLIIAVDQEGGQVARFKARDGFPASVSAREFARMGDEEAVTAAESMAAALAEAGVNLNLAPVVDLDRNPNNPIIGRYGRSFGADPGEVVRLARIFIEAHHRRGICCCLKHFPGHGSAAADSHLGFVDSSADWHKEELEPFARLLAGGGIEAVMTAHIVNRQLDPSGLPATLSPTMIRGTLRRELGFSGVVVSDDLQMGAITRQWGYAEAVRLAVLAGVDLLVVGNNLQHQPDALALGKEAILAMLARGEIDEATLRRSLERIAVLKQACGGSSVAQ